MTPTERSMPAVRMTRVLADAHDADDHNLREDGREIACGGEPRRIDEDPQHHAEQQHDKGHNSRIGVEETLGPLEKCKTFLIEGGDVRRRAGEDPLELLGRGTASRFAHRFLTRFWSPCFMDPPWAATRRILFYFRRLSSERWGKSTPADLQRLIGRDRRNTGNRLIGNELFTGVDACRLLAGLDVVRHRLNAVRRH